MARSRGADAGSGVPNVTLAVEQYNRMVRVLEKGIRVKVELKIQTAFHDETTPNGFNIIAEIPGVDPILKDEVVMIGAHFDSVAAGTGATSVPRSRHRRGAKAPRYGRFRATVVSSARVARPNPVTRHGVRETKTCNSIINPSASSNPLNPRAG